MTKKQKSVVESFIAGGDLYGHLLQLFLFNAGRIVLTFGFFWTSVWYIFTLVFVSEGARTLFLKVILAKVMKILFMPGYRLTVPAEDGGSIRMSASRFLHEVFSNPTLSDEYSKIIFLGSLAALIAVGAAAVAVWLYWKHGVKSQKDEFLRGQKVVEKDELVKMIGAPSHISIGGVPIPEKLLARNILCVGSMGTGKTVCIDQIIEDARAWGKKLVIYDKTGQYTSKFFRPGHDVILNPCEERCVDWSVFADMKEFTDAAMISSFFLPENKQTADPMWDNAARIVLEDAMTIVREHGGSMDDLRHIIVSYSNEELYEIFSKKMDHATALRVISLKNERGTDSVLLTLVSQPAFRFFSFFDAKNATFSVREFVRRDDDACLFLTSNPTQHEAIKPFISVWVELALAEAMSMGQSVEDMRLMFILDELASLPKLKALDPALTEARQFGVSTVIGIQNLAQLDDIYGKDAAHTYVSNVQTKLILRVEEEGSAKRLSETLGKEEVDEVNESKSFGAEPGRDGVNLSAKRTERHLVTASEIMILPDLTGFLKISGAHPIAKVTLTYKARDILNPSLVPRAGLMLSPVDPAKFGQLKRGDKKENVQSAPSSASEYQPDEIFTEEQSSTPPPSATENYW